MGNCLCMGLILAFWCTTPRLDVADDGLAAFMDMDVFDFDRLLGAASVALGAGRSECSRLLSNAWKHAQNYNPIPIQQPQDR
jgi:hypothetical protein